MIGIAHLKPKPQKEQDYISRLDNIQRLADLHRVAHGNPLRLTAVANEYEILGAERMAEGIRVEVKRILAKQKENKHYESQSR